MQSKREDLRADFKPLNKSRLLLGEQYNLRLRISLTLLESGDHLLRQTSAAWQRQQEWLLSEPDAPFA